MNIKPIKNKRDYNNALKQVEKLWDAKPKTKNGDMLDILTTLIEDYELKNFSIDSPDPASFLEYLMESRGMTRQDLAKYLGGKTRVSEILNRKRSLSLNMIRNLHFKLGISADLLISKVIPSRDNQ